MKKFILKTMLFTFPFFGIYFFNILFWKKDGDLIRLGYFYKNISPKSLVENQYHLNKKYLNLSELNKGNNHKFDILTIGDSFTDQGDLSYINYIANNNISVLNFDRELMEENPIQQLVNLLDGDFFDKIKIDFIVLQSVERYFIERCKAVEFNSENKIKSIINIKSPSEEKESSDYLKFFSNATLKIPTANIAYVYMDKPSFTKTFKIKTIGENLFTNNPISILVYDQDLYELKNKNDLSRVNECNRIINKISKILEKKRITLVLLIAPDKYDVYYPYIENKKKYSKSNFFDSYDLLDKNYRYVRSFDLLSKLIKKQKDVYYYSDTHWSPIAAKAISNEIIGLVKEN